MTEFDEFWKAYPKKVAKGDARKAWEQTKNIRPELAKILEAIRDQSRSDQWMKAGGQFIPYPATWLRAERWDDELSVALPGVVNEKPWYESATGIELKGKELGIDPFKYQSFPEFKAAVMRAAIKVA